MLGVVSVERSLRGESAAADGTPKRTISERHDYLQPTTCSTGTIMFLAPQIRQRMIQSPSAGSGEAERSARQCLQVSSICMARVVNSPHKMGGVVFILSELTTSNIGVFGPMPERLPSSPMLLPTRNLHRCPFDYRAATTPERTLGQCESKWAKEFVIVDVRHQSEWKAHRCCRTNAPADDTPKLAHAEKPRSVRAVALLAMTTSGVADDSRHGKCGHEKDNAAEKKIERLHMNALNN